MKVLAITSISPSHNAGDVQQRAVRSWVDAGLPVHSINAPEEVAVLSSLYPCTFVECGQAARMPHRKSYAPINAILQDLRESDYDAALVVNSDVEWHPEPGRVPSLLSDLFRACEGGLVFSSRKDHNGDHKHGTIYKHGFDAFFLHRRFLDVLPESMFVLGQTWWDYWLPYRFIAEGLPLFALKDPPFYHQRHQLQYDRKEWERMTEHFRWMESLQGYGTSAQHLTGSVFKRINSQAKWI